jgi:hypothetical protein
MPAKKIIAKPTAAPRRAPVKKAVAARKQPPKKAETVAAPASEKKPPKQRVRLVRDSFTMPEPDFALIAALKARAMAAKREAKKSELLRAGLHALMALDGPALVGALGRLQPLKLGRPKKGH